MTSRDDRPTGRGQHTAYHREEVTTMTPKKIKVQKNRNYLGTLLG